MKLHCPECIEFKLKTGMPLYVTGKKLEWHSPLMTYIVHSMLARHTSFATYTLHGKAETYPYDFMGHLYPKEPGEGCISITAYDLENHNNGHSVDIVKWAAYWIRQGYVYSAGPKEQYYEYLAAS